MNMQENLEQLLTYATQKNASDIHLTLHQHTLSIQLRIYEQMIPLVQDLWDESLFEYIKFISGFDLTNPYIPQNGQFSWKLGKQVLFCRFSLIPNKHLQTGVIRLLNTGLYLPIKKLTSKKEHQKFLENLMFARQGLVIACGPTNSEKRQLYMPFYMRLLNALNIKSFPWKTR